ncbi:MAG: glycine C-acetyltransferase [Lentisphaerae bacterium]|nr:glycine C-acetyltransferase [Lentisphaerota bacterium]
MKYDIFKELQGEIDVIRSQGLYKQERAIRSPQGTWISLAGGRRLLNLCANNYLGYAADPRIIAAAQQCLQEYGFGLSSVRFICGCQNIHEELEQKVSEFLGTEDSILYSSCFDANGGLFEPLFNAQDAIISDELNHASIIDGIRLSKAARYRYKNCDMNDLEKQLQLAHKARRKIIVTDGVFSMDGIIAPLPDICSLAQRYDALLMVDDSHATGLLGEQGKGSIEHCQVMGRVDLITSTFGKALGGAGGGFTSGRKEIIELLRQRSRPYLFSNSLSPAIIGASLKALELLRQEPQRRKKLRELAAFFRKGLLEAGFELKGADHPIIPIMLGEADKAQKMAALMLEAGFYLSGFFYPVVPLGQARIRTQLSAEHSFEDLDLAIQAFKESADKLQQKKP